MPGNTLFANRRLHVCYWDSEAKFSNAEKIQLESGLKRLADVVSCEIKSLDDSRLTNTDLLVVAAHTIEGPVFVKWLEKLAQAMHRPSHIWIPALIVSPVSFDEAADAMRAYVQKNWYFDTVHPRHFDSVPIRIANLIRIHDHIKELKRYDEQLKTLSVQVEQLEKQLQINK